MVICLTKLLVEKKLKTIIETNAGEVNAANAIDISTGNEMNIDSDSDILNYSIVKNTPDCPVTELKIKLRLSSKQKTMTTNSTPSRRSLRLSCANETPLTNTKRKINIINDATTPSKGKFQRRKSILNTELDSEMETPKKTSPNTTIKRNHRSSISIPSMSKRNSIYKNLKSDLHIARENLHVSAIPLSLPCREIEFENICNFLEDKILDESSGCMYVSGVPGTGKTATTTEVIRYLKDKSEKGKIPSFQFIEINGMRLTEPKQAYVQIYRQLIGKTLSADQAYNLLEKRFTTPGPKRLTTVLLVDELDMLCNRRQDVVYNLLDWPSKKSSRLVVITIANTMDLPERLLMGKVTSRLGLTRLTFQPYTYKQLEEIVNSRLNGLNSFKSDAIQLIARKVAAVSGDARRALDICRRATEIAEEEMHNENIKIVNMIHVQKALAGMIASPKVQAIKNCSRLEQIFLQAIAAEILRTGVEETVFNGVYIQFQSIVAFMGLSCPSIGKTLKLCTKLGSERLLICEHSRMDLFQKIFLNVSTDDIHYALQVKID